jgi:hypothetical protein
MKIYSSIYLMILIMYYKYHYFLIYLIKLKNTDYSESENVFLFGTEEA